MYKSLKIVERDQTGAITYSSEIYPDYRNETLGEQARRLLGYMCTVDSLSTFNADKIYTLEIDGYEMKDWVWQLHCYSRDGMQSIEEYIARKDWLPE
jgi:hypothetical protein